ncbi:MAG: hypothetical protein IBJ16_12925 [Chitinophagaceae bacterium]|nr:hypothetical protein [Chitinophagaceae bacterium]
MTGILSHGILDTIPHCYLIPSKIDASLGLLMIITAIWLCNKQYSIMVLSSFIGCIIPDLIDLSPSIINKQLGWSLPVFDKLFPWHFKQFSGSVYTDDCTISNINHTILVIALGAVCWYKRSVVREMFSKGEC